jgi:hypothetical protein
MMSSDPPGAVLNRIVIGFVGKVWACAAVQISERTRAVSARVDGVADMDFSSADGKKRSAGSTL